MRGFRQWKWHLDEVYVKINGELHYLWRAVDQEGEILESYVTKTRDKKAALRFTISDCYRWSRLVQSSNAAVPTNEEPAEIRLYSRQCAQSLQRPTPPRRQRNLQGFATQPHWLSGKALWPELTSGRG